MLKNKWKIILTGCLILLFLAIAVFYNTATAQPVNAEEIVKMTRAWENKSLKNGPWVHLVYAVTLKENSGVVLPNGQSMPLSYINDDWYYVNEAGLVEKGVFSIKDLDGNILQQSAYQNGIMINFTFDDRQDGQSPYPLNIDLGFENMIQEGRNKGLIINKSNDNKNGKPSIEYSYIEGFKLPTQLGNDQVIVDSIKTQGSFDKETEDFLQIQTIWILKDGKEVIYATSQIISIESFPEAINEILNILETVK